MSLTTEENTVIMDEIMKEVRAELDASDRTDLDIYDDSDEADAEMDRRVRDGIRLTLQKMKDRGLAIARYDEKKKKPYIEYKNHKYSIEDFDKLDK